MSVLIQGGTVVDQRGSRRADVRIDDGFIVEVADSLQPVQDEIELDATRCVVAPGSRR